MFLPNDLTEPEKAIVRTTAAQLLNRLGPEATDDDRRSTRLTAQEIAAEQIWADRHQASTSTDPDPEAWIPDSGDARSLQDLIDDMNMEDSIADE